MVALVVAYKEHAAIHMVFEETGHVKEPWMTLFDNQSCIMIAHDTGYSGGAKHIELRFLAIPRIVSRQKIQLGYLTSAENAADVMKKALLPQAHKNAAMRLCITDLQ